MAQVAQPIAVSPALAEAAERYANAAQKSVEKVVEEAIAFYIDFNPELNDQRRLEKQRAQALGLDMEEYAAIMIKAWRREEREREELNASRRS